MIQLLSDQALNSQGSSFVQIMLLCVEPHLCMSWQMPDPNAPSLGRPPPRNRCPELRLAFPRLLETQKCQCNLNWFLKYLV